MAMSAARWRLRHCSGPMASRVGLTMRTVFMQTPHEAQGTEGAVLAIQEIQHSIAHHRSAQITVLSHGRVDRKRSKFAEGSDCRAKIQTPSGVRTSLTKG